MNTSYRELYAQYKDCIEVQNEIIAKCRQDYISAIKAGNRNMAERLGRVLKIYYDERNDLVTGANEMKKYIETEMVS
ncbi:MAG: hypothetical protein IJW86_06945 [Clostridia bacterium]|nr:hypothetical protein [Clostridia bacterium]